MDHFFCSISPCWWSRYLTLLCTKLKGISHFTISHRTSGVYWLYLSHHTDRCDFIWVWLRWSSIPRRLRPSSQSIWLDKTSHQQFAVSKDEMNPCRCQAAHNAYTTEGRNVRWLSLFNLLIFNTDHQHISTLIQYSVSTNIQTKKINSWCRQCWDDSNGNVVFYFSRKIGRIRENT